MRSHIALLVLLVAMMASSSVSATADPKQKLQIGVKKRVAPEDCPIKSRKGDRLQMHYTVRTVQIHAVWSITAEVKFV